MIELRNLTKIYNENAENQVIALNHVSFTLPETGMVFLLGKSGSGKTTMLNLLGGLDAPTEGELCVDGVSSTGFRQKDWDVYRNNYVGFVFQEYNLLDDLTIGANIALALNLQGKMSKTDAEQKIATVLAQVGLSGYGSRKPGELSGGQKQRIAIARALVKNPHIILADEPTGALDSENGKQIFDLLKEISQEKLVVIVSHDEEFARRYADRIIELADGRVISDSTSSNAAKITYRSNAVHIPANYRFTDEEWAEIQAYMEACLRGENPEPPTGEAVEAVSELKASISEEAKAFKAKTVALPLKNAMDMALQSMKKRKVRLTVVAVLCTLAFLLVSVSDLVASYDRRNAMVKSLANSEFTQISITKEQYLDYDMTKVSPLLPTEEAVKEFQSSGLAYTPGNPGWYDGYMLDDADLQDLSDRTGMIFKGVYVPPSNILSLGRNYLLSSDEEDRAETPALTGFMDFTEADLELFGFSMVAGQLPDGEKDELSISKAVYEAFVKCGYYSFDYQVEIPYYTERANKYNPDSMLKLSWAEFIANDFQIAKDLLAEIKPTGGGYYSGARIVTTSTKIKDITCPEDLIGCTLFLENRFYTISGIIDTGFNLAVEADETAGKSLREQEQELGISYLAFVGDGKTAQIAARYPAFMELKDSAMTLSRDYSSWGSPWDKVGYHSLSNNLFGRISTLHSNFFNLPENVSDPLMRITQWLAENPRFQYEYEPNTYVTLMGGFNFEMRFTGSKSGMWLSAPIWTDHVFPDTVLGYLCSDLDHSLSDNIDNNIELNLYEDIFFLDDMTFDLLTEGRGGTYSYAIGVLPHSESSVTTLVDGVWGEIDNVRYKLENPVAYELDYLNNTLLSLSKVFRYIGLGMALFAIAIFWNFISNGIQQRKREIGILRALGANSNTIFRIFFTECFALAGINAVFATLLTFLTGVVGNWVMRSMMDSRLTMFGLNLRQVGIIFGLSFGIAIVSSAIPILRIAKQKPVDAIRE